ncbi:unnamed protein product [Durusdinium trenchii]|uniref:Secreted protein n=1 Tax=Durusdinium trenchii TaxID=1381693 RepID=A0ABP0PCY6_9DINO
MISCGRELMGSTEVVVMQILLQVVLVLQCYRCARRDPLWRRNPKRRAPPRTDDIGRFRPERERYHVEGLFLALRALDNHVLVYSVRPAVEERLGGSSCWKMKTVESRIAFSRFIFEDAEQCALQGAFCCALRWR